MNSFLRTTAFTAALLGLAPAHAATLRWANVSDALSLDPYANNETMTLRFLGNMALVHLLGPGMVGCSSPVRF